MTPLSRRARALGLVLTLTTLVAACGSDSAEDAAPAATTEPAEVTTAAPPATEAPDATDAPAAPETTEAAAPETTEAPVAYTVPDGTTLRVGDQNRTLELPLTASGDADLVQAEVEYATFAGGPPLIEAFNAGALDLGYVGDTPPVLAQARGQDIVIVAAWKFNANLLAIVAPPGKEITSVADLAGKKFAYTRGTALQAFALRALQEAGLTEADVENVDVPILDVVGALKSGDVDAGVVAEPILTGYLAENPDARVVRDAEGLTSGLQLLITTKATLEDPAKEAAIGDFIARQVAAFEWRQANPEEYIAQYAEVNQIEPEVARSVIERNGTRPYIPIDEDVIAELQLLADIFHEAGSIPDAIDVHEIFDDRFNPIVEAGGA